MFSTKSVRRNFCTLINKLGLSDSKTSYKKIATVEESKNINSSRGYITMYVGEELKRYQVPVKYLSLPMFQELISAIAGGWSWSQSWRPNYACMHNWDIRSITQAHQEEPDCRCSVKKEWYFGWPKSRLTLLYNLYLMRLYWVIGPTKYIVC